MEYEKHSPDFDYLIKILIDGLLGVGKTSLISQYVEEDIELSKHPSINFKLYFLLDSFNCSCEYLAIEK